MQNLIIASTSTIHKSAYLEYILDELKELFKDTNSVLFIPYARPSGISYDEYTLKARIAFSKINKNILGIHQMSNPTEALKKAKGIFVGGGNTFVLVDALYKYNIIEPLKSVIISGTPYLGTSAGSNICGLNLKTTNDMPIVSPPSFDTLGILPFNINPHYLDADKKSTHMGETRETRIKEFHKFNSIPVIGLREGSWIRVVGESKKLGGNLKARVFNKNKEAYEILSGSNLNDIT